MNLCLRERSLVQIKHFSVFHWIALNSSSPEENRTAYTPYAPSSWMVIRRVLRQSYVHVRGVANLCHHGLTNSRSMLILGLNFITALFVIASRTAISLLKKSSNSITGLGVEIQVCPVINQITWTHDSSIASTNMVAIGGTVLKPPYHQQTR